VTKEILSCPQPEMVESCTPMAPTRLKGALDCIMKPNMGTSFRPWPNQARLHSAKPYSGGTEHTERATTHVGNLNSPCAPHVCIPSCAWSSNSHVPSQSRGTMNLVIIQLSGCLDLVSIYIRTPYKPFFSFFFFSLPDITLCFPRRGRRWLFSGNISLMSVPVIMRPVSSVHA
jgi:hypothetical protein